MNPSDSGLGAHYLEIVTNKFQELKGFGEKAMAQLSVESHFHTFLDKESNSIAIIIRHLSGSMVSRWTDFLTTDGEKPDRQRDGEFDREVTMTSEELLEVWNRGWDCLFQDLGALTPADLEKKVTIRGVEHPVLEAIQTNLIHAASHVGQIVFLAKHFESEKWESLSIPHGQSDKFFRSK